MRILVVITIVLLMGLLYRYNCDTCLESYTLPYYNDYDDNFDTIPKSGSRFIDDLGGPETISQTNDLPLVPDDQNPWFWSLDIGIPVYNRNGNYKVNDGYDP